MAKTRKTKEKEAEVKAPSKKTLREFEELVARLSFPLSEKAKELLLKYITIRNKRIDAQKRLLKLITLRSKQRRLDQRGKKKTLEDKIKELPLFAPRSNVIAFRRKSDKL